MDRIRQFSGIIGNIHVQPVDMKESFPAFASRFAALPGTCVLLSGGELDCARYHILAAKPWLTFTGRGTSLTLRFPGQTLHLNASPLEVLRVLLQTFKLDFHELHSSREALSSSPVAAGLFGYLSYDLKDCIGELPRTSLDDLHLPHICLFAPSILVVHDNRESSTRLFIPERIIEGKSSLGQDLAEFSAMLSSPSPGDGGCTSNSFSNVGGALGNGFRSNFTRAGYIDAIKIIKEYISAGHVYQVNMSQRFEMDFQGDSFDLFLNLYRRNPAPFFAYVNAGDHQVVSTSPERFIQRVGEYIETRPIKGTRPRGGTPEEDERFGVELRNSRKDDAELSMIVDLMRNDLGKVCKAGSVKVSSHKRLEAYQNVYHLVSIVEGRLAEEKDSVDLITATFPGGSITGCPKIRSMEIIDELEPCRRHVYTGSIGYIGFHDTMDLSIAIRTVTVCHRKIFFSVGGGIIFDSNPEEEFEETLHKGRTLMETFTAPSGTRLNTTTAVRKSMVWLNGRYLTSDEASIPLRDPGFQYGKGFFETLRANNGTPMFLTEHVERFNRAWEHFFSHEPPDLTWNEIIHQVLLRNDLLNEIAAVKLIAAAGERTTPPYGHSLIVTVRPYTHRLKEKSEPGLHLAIYPEARQTPLADHKTLNYLFYLLAGEWARRNGADEALILNPDGGVSETNSANILLVMGNTLVRPVSPHVLPGVMESAVCRLLNRWDYKTENRRVMPGELLAADHVILTNSLMGAVPVIRFEGKKLTKSLDSATFCNKINEFLLCLSAPLLNYWRS